MIAVEGTHAMLGHYLTGNQQGDKTTNDRQDRNTAITDLLHNDHETGDGY